jgi:topoisomerase IV subunit B
MDICIFCKRLCFEFEIKKKPFKGLGEISPDEFKHFIGKDIRLEPVILGVGTSIPTILSYYMGKNTPERQNHIIANLRVEKDLVDGAVAIQVEEKV